MSVINWFVTILILIVIFAVLWVYFIRPAFIRLSNYIYLFFILSKIRPFDPQELRIKNASRLIQYDQVVRLLTIIRRQPVLTTKELNYSRKIIAELRREEYSEADILRASINMIRQYSAFGFEALPLQLEDEAVKKITDIVTRKLAKGTDFKPAEIVFFIVLGNKNLSHYLK